MLKVKKFKDGYAISNGQKKLGVSSPTRSSAQSRLNKIRKIAGRKFGYK